MFNRVGEIFFEILSHKIIELYEINYQIDNKDNFYLKHLPKIFFNESFDYKSAYSEVM